MIAKIFLENQPAIKAPKRLNAETLLFFPAKIQIAERKKKQN